MANIMDMVKLRNKTSRNGFDLSRKNLFTAKVGEMLPVACIECIPGDSFDIDLAWFTRTQPVNTAAYTRMREYYDWYFVPTNLLWNKFNTFVTQMTDNNMKAVAIDNNSVLIDEHPYFTVADIVNYILKPRIWNTVSHKENYFGYNRAVNTIKLLNYLDYGDFSAVSESNIDTSLYGYTNAKLNPFPLLAYQKIYQDHVRNSQWEKAYAPACNIDYISGEDGSLNIPIHQIDWATENMFDLRYFNWNKDYFMGLLPNSQYGDAASINLEGISDIRLPLNEPTSISQPIYVEGQSGEVISTGAPLKTGAPSGVTNRTLLSADSIYLQQYLSANNISHLRDALGISNSINIQTALQSYFTILALRQAEAKQRWSEITQSQQQDYKSQIQAHFGVNVSDAYSERSRYIGGVAGNVDISAVTNNNLTGDNDANIAGVGQGGARGSINFNTEVHGYLMCIYHAVPLLDYQLSGIKRQNLKTKVTDYAIPEFDATGMVSVPAIEMFNNRYVTLGSTGEDIDVSDKLLGYAPRYIDYKTSYDLVHGAFVNGGLDAWVAPVGDAYIQEYLQSRTLLGDSNLLNYQFMKIPPSVVNPIFGFDADSKVDTDQLLVNCGFDIKAVRNLDRNGLPY